MTDLPALRAADPYAWAREQARALLPFVDAKLNLPLDLEGLIQELEWMADDRKRRLVKSFRTIAVHLLKLACSPARYPRDGWRTTIVRGRNDAEDLMTDRLREEALGEMQRVFEAARREAVSELESRRETSAAASVGRLRGCPFTLDQLLDHDWWPADAAQPDPAAERKEQP